MDAMPMTLGQEVSGWRAHIDNSIDRLKGERATPAGAGRRGTAIGNRINAHEKVCATFIDELRASTKLDFATARQTTSPRMASQDRRRSNIPGQTSGHARRR
jgi:fumarate hydratase class II